MAGKGKPGVDPYPDDKRLKPYHLKLNAHYRAFVDDLGGVQFLRRLIRAVEDGTIPAEIIRRIRDPEIVESENPRS